MRNFKRFLTLALAVVMVASVFTFGASAATFTDVDENNETLVKAVNLLSHVGITKGTSETTFGTEDLVTREQMAAFIYRLMKKGQSVEGGANTSPFADLEDDTFFFMVSWANSQGIIKGTSATTFNPKGSITLQDGYTMLVRALGYEKEEALQYPFGFIEVAEGEGVELNEGLRDMQYTEALTRGDVAVLLYNAFFAETGVAETKNVEKEFSNGDPYLATVTEYPTFCEKYFDVLELEFQAIATPNNVFTGATETTKSLGYDAVHFKYVGETEDLGDCKTLEFYADVEDLALENADDYIMSYFRMYVTLDEEDAIDEILFAEPLMTKTTTSDIKFETLTATNKNAYYNKDIDAAKLLSGKVLVDGEAAYFYNAPYSYVKPAYAPKASDVEKYLDRNDNNLQFINVALLNNDEEEGELAYSVAGGINLAATDANGVDLIDGNGDVVKTYKVDEYHASEAVELVNAMGLAYVGGLYEADLYDVDGDGIYDYIDYKPYSFAIVDTNEKEEYEYFKKGIETDSSKDDYNVLYTEGVVVDEASVEFKDEDLVIGYFDQNANYIKVAAVVAPVEATVEDIDADEGVIVLSTEEEVSVKDGFKLVTNNFSSTDLATAKYLVSEYDFTKYDALLSANAYDADDAKFYIYEGVVLYQDGITNKADKLDMSNLAIITPNKKGDTSNVKTNEETFEDTLVVYTWIDGVEGYKMVEVEDLDNTPALEKASDVAVGGKFYNKLATYSVDSDGLYTFNLLSYTDKNNQPDGLLTDVSKLTLTTKDEDNDVQVSLALNSAYLVKNFGSRYALKTGTATTDGYADANADFDLVIGADTKIIIKNTYNDTDGDPQVKWYVFDESNPITETITNPLTDIQYVVENDPKYTSRENLVVLYATVDGAKLRTGDASTGNERVVKASSIKKDAEGYFYNNYTLLNPYTGATETATGTELVAKSTQLKKAYANGTVVTLVGTNVDEDSTAVTFAKINDNANLYWIREYDAESEMIEICVVGDESKSWRLDVSDVAVTSIGAQSKNMSEMISYTAMSVVEIADLNGENEDLYAVNTRYIPKDEQGVEIPDADFETVYGKYLKAYVHADWEDDANHDVLDTETGFNGEANFIVIVANTEEAAANCDTSEVDA